MAQAPRVHLVAKLCYYCNICCCFVWAARETPSEFADGIEFVAVYDAYRPGVGGQIKAFFLLAASKWNWEKSSEARRVISSPCDCCRCHVSLEEVKQTVEIEIERTDMTDRRIKLSGEKFSTLKTIVCLLPQRIFQLAQTWFRKFCGEFSEERVKS